MRGQPIAVLQQPRDHPEDRKSNWYLCMTNRTANLQVLPDSTSLAQAYDGRTNPEDENVAKGIVAFLFTGSRYSPVHTYIPLAGLPLCNDRDLEESRNTPRELD
jgi:hypothetical protein